MTIKTNRWIRLVLALTAGTTVGVGVILNLPLIPLIVVPVGVGASVLLGRTVTNKVMDERLIHLANAAARWSFSIFCLAACVTGAVFVALDRSAGSMWWAGMVLLFSASFLMVLYYALYIIFTKKH